MTTPIELAVALKTQYPNNVELSENDIDNFVIYVSDVTARGSIIYVGGRIIFDITGVLEKPQTPGLLKSCMKLILCLNKSLKPNPVEAFYRSYIHYTEYFEDETGTTLTFWNTNNGCVVGTLQSKDGTSWTITLQKGGSPRTEAFDEFLALASSLNATLKVP